MKTLLVCVQLIVLNALALPSFAQESPKPQIKITYLQHEPVSGDVNKEAYTLLVEFPPGASTGRHVHPGDEYAAVIEGELQLNVDGQPPRIASSGHGYHNTAGTVHESKNVGPAPTRVVSTLIIERGKPISIPVP